MSEIRHTPVTDDTFIMGYKVGAGLHGTIEDANKAIRRGEGDSWIPLYRKNHAGAELLEALQSLDKRFRLCMEHCVTASEAYDSFYQEIVSEAIAKATGAA